MKARYQQRRFLKHRNAASYRPAWRFPPLIEHEIQKWILAPCLHVCSGASTLGDVRVDLYERADVQAAMRYLPFQRGYFMSVIWDPPYALSRRQSMPVLIELRSMLNTGGRLISVHFFDPSCFLQRTMRLIYKAYYDPKGLGGVRVVTVIEKLPMRRIPPKRRDRLLSMPTNLWEPEPLPTSLLLPATAR